MRRLCDDLLHKVPALRLPVDDSIVLGAYVEVLQSHSTNASANVVLVSAVLVLVLNFLAARAV